MTGTVNVNDDDKHVGILALEVYTPRTFVEQSDLEQHMGVSAGKYTIGLGQEGLALTGDAEDINSISLTAVHGLLEKYNIDPSQVGRIEVGTETLVDKSKSTKTILMDLFPNNSDIEGATTINACYGGTAALLNAFLWCESSGWDGRYAIVVAADIATYAHGPARPTCGCGAVAVLVGRDAPLSYHPHQRATHASNTWDFYKPNHEVEYPVVDGALSQVCYYQALEDCYERFCQKMQACTQSTDNTDSTTAAASAGTATFDVNSPDYMVFHAPYNKLVQKSFGRLFLVDARANADEKKEEDDELADWLHVPIAETYADKVLEKKLRQVSAKAFEEKLADANHASKIVGNTYTASIFLGLASLVDRVGGRGELTPGKFLVLFSYGSGALATMYGLRVRTPTQTKFTIESMAKTLNLTPRLAQRERVEASELDRALDTRARMHTAGAPYQTIYPHNRLFPGTYYLKSLDDQWRRTYARVPVDAPLAEPGTPLAPPAVLQAEMQAKLEKKSSDGSVSCIITGTAAGLPGHQPVFSPENMQRLIHGENCLTPISEETKQAMLEKNIVQMKKTKAGPEHIPLKDSEDMIQLAGVLGDFDLMESYGVPASLAKTMDVASQVAVAAGMEALKDAGLVSGKSNAPEEWRLPVEYRDSTAVIYASSFPAMDAAVREVIRFMETGHAAQVIQGLQQRLKDAGQELTAEEQANLERYAQAGGEKYTFDRKFLFRVLVLANAQLAQLAGCQGPNTQTNAACAGTTQAIGIAQDMLTTGRAERVVVIAGDNASGDVLMPWVGSGFRVLGAATNKCKVEEAAVPFDKRRSGMLMGAGGVAIVVESAASVAQRQLASHDFKAQARLLATRYSNSAYHGASLDQDHLGEELVRFLADVETKFGITKEEIAKNGVYFSHETCTHASKEASCAGNEVAFLRFAFGEELLKELLILNTKGFTGHPMGVSFEDVTAVGVLQHQRVPAISNYRVCDDYLGDLKLSKGGDYPCKYALRFAGGFGSQTAFALYGTMD